MTRSAHQLHSANWCLRTRHHSANWRPRAKLHSANWWLGTKLRATAPDESRSRPGGVSLPVTNWPRQQISVCVANSPRRRIFTLSTPPNAHIPGGPQ
jgi:hypothetical protein